MWNTLVYASSVVPAEAVHIIVDKEAESKAETRGLALKATPLVIYSPTVLHLHENLPTPQQPHKLRTSTKT